MAQDDVTKPSDETSMPHPSAESAAFVTAVRGATAERVFVKVATSATATVVRVKYDPVSLEEARQTRALNRAVRLGFVPPVASTR